MANEVGSRMRYGEAFLRSYHEAWYRSDLNQRQYCEVHGIHPIAYLTARDLNERCAASPNRSRRAGEQESRMR